MRPQTVEQICSAVEGRALGTDGSRTKLISSVCTDTRALTPGCLFIALRGEHFDGHRFIAQAIAAGAAAILVEQSARAPTADAQFILVSNTRAALGKLARFVRGTLGAKVIAVAGSNGKTSTKFLINSILSAKLRGSMSPKSFNNDIGVPLTILPADPAQDYLVLELGTNHPGEIANLTDIARPDIGLITNCGAEHLEFLGDLKGVRQENATLISGMAPRGLLIVNGDDEELLTAVKGFSGRIITFGFEPTNDLYAADVRLEEDGTRFKLNGRLDVFVPMLGRHSAANALAAIAVARALRMSEADIVKALALADAPDMRLQLQHLPNGMMLLNDAYNANPNSMRAALETVAGLPTAGGRIAVLGDMKELGAAGARYHQEMGALARTCGLKRLACVGPLAKFIGESAAAAGMPQEAIRHFEDAQAAAAAIPAWLGPNDLLLLKASRAVGLEKVADAVIATFSRPAARKAAS